VPCPGSGMAQLSTLGHEILLRFSVSQIGRRRFSAVRILVSLAQTFLDGARLALICRRRASAAACRKFGGDYLRTFL
jgi:hypothetical protein